jgi:ATP adenylyltransferase
LAVVPRSAAEVEGIPINALGYAGSFVAFSRDQLERIEAIGPVAVLTRAGVAVR